MDTRFDASLARDTAELYWEREIVPALVEYIGIPNQSPHFDKDWASAGHMEAAVGLAERWCRAQPIDGIHVEVVRLAGRTPVLYVDIPSQGLAADASDDPVLLYGHLDKQPEMTGWREGLEPWKAVREGDRLYGRGGADDGYAVFASLTAIRLLREQGVPHARCAVLIECCEESGSYDLPAYIDALAPRIGSPSLVVCLDSGCGNYEQLWVTTSLRGLVAGTLRVQVLREGVHSGDASGVVPSSFRIARMLLSRIEDEASGKILVPELFTEIPEQRVRQARVAADALGPAAAGKYPWHGGTRPMHEEPAELLLNRTWRPTLSVVGADAIPPIATAGNVLRPVTSLKLSLRIPPRVDPQAALAAVKAVLERDPPYGADVRFEHGAAAPGWDAPETAPWLEQSLDRASQRFFGKPAANLGEGGTIPFMGMLGEKFPRAQFVITGVLGPESNAHGPNEFLDLPTGKKLTGCVAQVLADHAARAHTT